MTQDERNLLMKDLGARLLHHVKVRYSSTKQFFVCNLQAMNPSYTMVDLWSKDGCFTSVHVDKIKPYLFPMSSMTEEQREKYESLCETSYSRHYDCGPIAYKTKFHDTVESIDYLIENHFDYRGLIPMGLALDATNLNIY